MVQPIRPIRAPRQGHREALLDAAFEALTSEGDDFSLTHVAQRAKASKALLFHHFGTRDGLLDAMAQRVLSETQTGLDALANDFPNPRERLEALTRALLAEPPEPPAATRRVMRFWLGDAERGSARDALVADFVAKTLKEMRSRADARRVASMLLARWHGATAVYANGSAVDFEGEAERAVAELERLFRTG